MPDSSPPPDASLENQQDVTGDRNQTIAHMSGGTAIANVEILNQITQQQPQLPESARYSLPLDAADFVGRGDEIEQIEAGIKAGRVVAISGMAGVGKSALAVRVAHRLKASFPDGQIYLNLRGADSHPLTVEAALESLLRALGVDPAQIPVELADRVALYRSKMAQTQTLVLLDNAAETRQVEDLLPGTGACLITSRRQLDGLAGVTHRNLAALPEDQALELFQKVLSPQRVQAELKTACRIVAYCGRLPLALRIAAATLGMRSWQGKQLATYAQQLADERQRLDRLKLENLDVRASFELSYRELIPSVAYLLGWLGLLPADFSTAILAPLTQEPVPPVQQALAALVDGRLVDPYNPATGERYILHDLMRLFALEKLAAEATPEAVQAATIRLVQWCEEQADSWENALDPTRRRQWAEALAAEMVTAERESDPTTATDLESSLLQEALSWFEAERLTLVYAFDWAATTQQWQASVALAANLAPFFNLRGYWEDWVYTHQQALTAARQASDSRSEATTLNNLGVVYESQGKWSETISVYEQSLQIYRSLGDVHSEAQTLGNLGSVYESQGNWSEAIAALEQSLHIFRSLGDVHSEAKTLDNLGSSYRSQGKWGEAIAAHEQSLQIKQSLGDVHGEAQTLGNLGSVYESQGNWSEAIAVLEQSLQTFRLLGDVHGEGTILNNLGVVYESQGKWGEAITAHKQSLQICRSLGDVHGEGGTLNNLGVVYESQGNWSEAIAAHKQSLQICRSLGDVHGEAQSLNNLGNVHKSQGKWGEAIAAYEQSLQIKQALGDVHGEARSFGNLGNVYQAQEKFGEAIAAYEQSLSISRSLGDVHGEAKILGNLGVVYESQGKWGEAITAYEQSLQIKRSLGDVHGEGRTLGNLGNVYYSQRKWDEAITAYEQSLQIKRSLGDAHGEGQILVNMGHLHQKRGCLNQAAECWRDAITKLHPDSLEYRQIYANFHPGRGTIVTVIGVLVLEVVALMFAVVFVVSNLRAGRWLVALAIVGIAVVAFRLLNTLLRQRQT